MVAVEVWLIIVVVMLIFSIGLQLEARYSAKDYLEDYDQALDEMRKQFECSRPGVAQTPRDGPTVSDQ